MRAFSFFCAVSGGPGLIRGRQMAHHLKGRFNPPPGEYDEDVCIHILGTSTDNRFNPAYVYHDLMDCGLNRIRRVSRMRGGLIAVSKCQYPVLKEMHPRREIYIIPQHHCNFKRELRESRPVLRVGTIGGDSAVQWPHQAMDRMFRWHKMEWVYGYNYRNRTTVVDFYKNLDVQVVFRPTHSRGLQLHMNPLKLSNAGSFGIPTVTYPEPGYTAEWKDECLWADTIEGLVSQVIRLRDETGLYEDIAGKARAKAEEYHIDKVGELYRDLPGVRE